MKLFGSSDERAGRAPVGILIPLSVALTVAISSCDSPTTGLSSTPRGARLAVSPEVLILNNGDTGEFEARLLDGSGQLATARSLEWTSLQPGVASVSSDGRVEAKNPGEATVSVRSRAHGAETEVLVIVRPVADDLVFVVRDEVHQGIAGDPLPDSVHVRVVDKGGLPVSGFPVSFDVDAGSGVVSSDVVATDAQGFARVEWTLGIEVGANTVEVSEAEGAGSGAYGAPPRPRGPKKKLHAWGGAGEPRKVLVSPESQTLTVEDSDRLIATVLDKWGNEVEDAHVQWSSSDETVATVDQEGSVLGRKVGLATVNASVVSASPSSGAAPSGAAGTIQGSAKINVEPPGANATLSRVSGDGQTGSVGQTLAEPLVVRLRESGVGVPGVAVSWSVSLGGGQVSTHSTTTDASGTAQAGWTLGTRPGAQEVTAWVAGSNAVTFQATAEVGGAANIVVLPSEMSLESGATQQMSARVTDAYDNEITHRPVSWSSTDGSVASVDVGGFVSAVSAGEAQVSASLDGASGSSNVAVTGSSGGDDGTLSVRIADSSEALNAIGSQRDLTAIVADEGGSVVSGAEVAWASLNPGVVTVDSFGRITSVATGVAMITASLASGAADTATIQSRQVVATVTLQPGDVNLESGQSVTLTATAADSMNVPVADASYAWTSTDEAVASLAPDGSEERRRVVAQGVGSATVVVESGEITGLASVTVDPVPVATVTVSPASMALTVGESATATAELRDADGNLVENRAATWSSSDPAVATVTDGVVTAIASGTADVVAEADGASASVSVTVESAAPPPPPPPPAVAVVDVTPTNVEVSVGETAQLSAQPRAADGTELSRPVTWTSTNPSVATVDASGKVTGTGSGTTVVTASSEGASGSASVTVTDGSQTEVDVVLSPGQNVQQIINNNPPGTVFGFEPGTYARLELTPKDNQVFVGGGGVVLDGKNDTRFAFHGAAVGLHLKDLEITGYTGMNDDFAAIHGWSGVDWVLENLNVHHNYTSGASIRHGGRVIGGHYHHNGKLGIYVTQTQGVEVSGVEISHNNLDGRYDPLWDAGGIKITVSSGIIVKDSYVHDNNGSGIWYDINADNGLVLNNTVVDNNHAGIFYEVSQGGRIEGNVVRNNGHESGWHGAGILISESAGCVVVGNEVVGNKHGIIGLDTDRREWGLSNNEFYGNTIDMTVGYTGFVDGVAGGANLTTERGNVFHDNIYVLHGRAEPFWPNNTSASLAEWQAMGQDAGSSF